MDMERKSFTGIELKDDKKGEFTARIATLNVIDKDGDVTLPGAFPEGKSILISAYQHESWMGALPVGKGVIREDGDDVLVDGQFNLKTETGKEHYETVKFAPELQEWSYGFTVKDFEQDAEWEGNSVYRILKEVDVYEASPVLRGAGIDTATLAIKSDDKGETYTEEADAALAAVDALLARTKSLADLRKEEGRTLSEANIERMKALSDEMRALLTEIDELIITPESVDEDAVKRVYHEYIRTQSKLQGVNV